MLKRKGFKSYYRVPAFNENDTYSSILVNISYGERPKSKEIACIASHLYAMYLASKENSSFPYALIIEDDIRFELEVDWAAMITDAPRDFTILQITTSNSEFVESEWKKYVNESQQLFSFQNSTSSLKTKEGGALKGSQITPLRREPSFWFDRSQWHHPIWSTQGYIINTAKIRQEINNYVHIDPVTEAVSIQLTATKIFACRENPCLIPFRVVADIYLYSIFAPTYTSKIPLLNGVTGEEHGDIESYIQSNLSVKTHKEQFHRITQILNEIGTKNRTLMPSFLYYHRL